MKTTAVANTVTTSPDIESRTLRRLLREGIQLLSHAGVDNAENEAAWIVECALGMHRATLHADAQRIVTSAHWSYAMALLERRAAREPLQYILGTQEFCGLQFDVGPEVLIPRPETELLVEEVVRCCAGSPWPRIADIGTGSGCIAVALADRLPRARLYAVDLSMPALDLAQHNAARHGVKDRITFLQGDLVEPLQDHGCEYGSEGRFAAIVSNPPYIADAELSALSPEVAKYEPQAALSGGPDGLAIIRRLLHEAPTFLAPGGRLILEMGYGQAEAVRRIALDRNAYSGIRIIKDAGGIDRVICLETPVRPV